MARNSLKIPKPGTDSETVKRPKTCKLKGPCICRALVPCGTVLSSSGLIEPVEKLAFDDIDVVLVVSPYRKIIADLA